jgi:lipoprotein-anchoring transpeptidase ErfK/SrfK
MRRLPALRRAVRMIVVVAGVAALTTLGSVAVGSARVTTSTDVVSVQPAGQTVGVAHPVTVTFAGPIADRAAAERIIDIDIDIDIASPEPSAGTFTWLSDRVVEFTPTTFWPAYSTITVTAGGAKTNFQTGAKVVSVADISAHTFTVSIDGEVAREMPASMGKPKYPTPTGTFTALEKQRRVTFDSRTIGIPLDDPEGYLIKGEYGVRVTWGGVYVHSAPWSVGSQGYANVSHGCINLSPDNAAWYFDTVRLGDPIIVQA